MRRELEVTITIALPPQQLDHKANSNYYETIAYTPNRHLFLTTIFPLNFFLSNSQFYF